MGSVVGWLCLAALVIALANRERIGSWLDRLERRQAAREARITALRRSPHGHMGLTIDHVSSETPPVETVWLPAGDGEGARAHFVWDGQSFAAHEDAEAARQAHILAKARAYYVDLDEAHGRPARVGTPARDPRARP